MANTITFLTTGLNSESGDDIINIWSSIDRYKLFYTGIQPQILVSFFSFNKVDALIVSITSVLWNCCYAGIGHAWLVSHNQYWYSTAELHDHFLFCF